MCFHWTCTTQSGLFRTLRKKAVENIVGKEEKQLVTSIFSFNSFITQSQRLTTLEKKAALNIVEREKMLATTIFSFSYNIFYLIKNRNHVGKG